MLALMAAGCLFLARIVRLGLLARTVLTGFLTGVGIQVAFGQLAGLLGIVGGGISTLMSGALERQCRR